jgi:hypothetical protein
VTKTILPTVAVFDSGGKGKLGLIKNWNYRDYNIREEEAGGDS